MSSLNKYRMQETGALHLLDAGGEPMFADGPDGKPDPAKPMRAHMFGPGSKQYAVALNRKHNHQIDLLKAGSKTKETADQAADSNAKFLAGCTDRFENIDETPLDAYRDQALSFIRDQVAAYLNDTGNFMPGSPNP